MKKVYSYQISLKNDKANRCVLQALAWWTKQAGVQFVEGKDQPDLLFFWQEHAKYPVKIARCEPVKDGSRTVHWLTFDPRVKWAMGRISRFLGLGDDLRLLAAHEVGHALGLSHNDSSDSLMHPEPVNLRLTEGERGLLKKKSAGQNA
jgi:predicted Zn-dependent protease